MKYTEWLKNIKGYSDKTIETYARYSIEYEICGSDHEKLIRGYSNRKNSTKRLVLSAVKSYLIFLNDPKASEIKLPKKNFVVSDYVTFEEYKLYMSKINLKSWMGFQKYLIIRILFETGIRANELLSITKKCISENRIKIYGKGNKERYVIISNWLKADLEKYIKGLKTDRLFTFEYKNLYLKIKRLDKKRNLSPHMFRHGFARYCFQKGISIYDISLSMGHSSIDTTAKYINKKSEDSLIHKIFS